MAEHMLTTHAGLILSPSIRKKVRREEETVYRNRKLDKEIGEEKHWGLLVLFLLLIIKRLEGGNSLFHLTAHCPSLREAKAGTQGRK